MAKYSTFTICVRPGDGLPDELVTHIMQWIDRSCDWYHAVSHKALAEKHLHAALFLKKPCTTSNLNNTLCSLACFKSFTEYQISAMRKGTKIMYNWGFIDEYLTLQKYMALLVATKLPLSADRPEVAAHFFPDKDDKRACKPVVISGKFQKWEIMFIDWLTWPHIASWAPTYEDLLAEGHYTYRSTEELFIWFFSDMFNVSRKINVITDPTRAANEIKAFVMYVLKTRTTSHRNNIKHEGYDKDEEFANSSAK